MYWRSNWGGRLWRRVGKREKRLVNSNNGKKRSMKLWNKKFDSNGGTKYQSYLQKHTLENILQVIGKEYKFSLAF